MKFKTLLIKSPAVQLAVYEELTKRGGYEAIVQRDSIKVGCQTFSPSILEKLVEAHKAVSTV